MPSRYFSSFPETKISNPGGSNTNPAGPDNKKKIAETTANWPTPGPSPGVGFNRKTKWPVVKTRAKKAGLD